MTAPVGRVKNGRDDNARQDNARSMTTAIDLRERHDCWVVMSDLFVDNEVDYAYIAASLRKRCPNLSHAALEAAFFDEVAPVLGSNLLTPIPPVWLAFADEDVIREISVWLDEQQASAFSRFEACCRRAICRRRCIFRSIWQALDRELTALRAP
ncbi:hypothetical protein WK13_16675 [Burkholderia ubonensis]|nr:hypothetical protein WK13_16675 [Burkholderia ubonensis]